MPSWRLQVGDYERIVLSTEIIRKAELIVVILACIQIRAYGCVYLIEHALCI